MDAKVAQDLGAEPVVAEPVGLGARKRRRVRAPLDQPLESVADAFAALGLADEDDHAAPLPLDPAHGRIEDDALGRGVDQDEVKAVEWYLKAAENGFVVAQANLAGMYMWTGHWEEALEESQRALEINPVHPVGLYVLGSTYTGMGRFEEAIETHTRGAAISTYNPTG